MAQVDFHALHALHRPSRQLLPLLCWRPPPAQSRPTGDPPRRDASPGPDAAGGTFPDHVRAGHTCRLFPAGPAAQRSGSCRPQQCPLPSSAPAPVARTELWLLPPAAGAPAAHKGVSSRPAQRHLPPAAVSPAARRNGSCRPQQCLLPPSAAAPVTRRSGACRGEQHLLPPGGAALAARRMSSCRPTTRAPVGPTRRLLPPAATSLAARRSGSSLPKQRHLPPGGATLAARRTYRPAKRLLSPGVTALDAPAQRLWCLAPFRRCKLCLADAREPLRERDLETLKLAVATAQVQEVSHEHVQQAGRLSHGNCRGI